MAEMKKRGVKPGTKRGPYNKNKKFSSIETEYKEYRKKVYQKKYYLKTKYGVDVSKPFTEEITSIKDFMQLKDIAGPAFEDVKQTTLKEAYQSINKESADILSERLRESDVEGARGLTSKQIQYGQLNEAARQLWNSIKDRKDLSANAKYEMVNALFGSE